MAFLFSCSMEKLNCFVEKKDGNGKYHMRTVIVLLPTPPHIIIAIVSYTFVSSFVSSLRLVNHLVSHFVLRHRPSPSPSHSCHLPFATTPIHPISIPSRHEHEPDLVNTNIRNRTE